MGTIPYSSRIAIKENNVPNKMLDFPQKKDNSIIYINVKILSTVEVKIPSKKHG